MTVLHEYPFVYEYAEYFYLSFCSFNFLGIQLGFRSWIGVTFSDPKNAKKKTHPVYNNVKKTIQSRRGFSL